MKLALRLFRIIAGVASCHPVFVLEGRGFDDRLWRRGFAERDHVFGDFANGEKKYQADDAFRQKCKSERDSDRIYFFAETGVSGTDHHPEIESEAYGQQEVRPGETFQGADKSFSVIGLRLICFHRELFSLFQTSDLRRVAVDLNLARGVLVFFLLIGILLTGGGKAAQRKYCGQREAKALLVCIHSRVYTTAF